MSHRGFILHPSYRIESGRPVVHLWGRLETGQTFLVRDGRQIPHFFVRETDAAPARSLGARPLTPAGRVALSGESLVRVEVEVPADAPALRNRLIAQGIPCYEADIRFALRYLIDRRIRGCVEILGSPRAGSGVLWVFEDPEVGPADFTPRLSVLSFDIETDRWAQKILSISLVGCGASEVLLLVPEGAPSPGGAVSFSTERELLEAFCARVREIDPDVLTGWNVIDFDLSVLVRLSRRQGVGLEIGRGPGLTRVDPARSRWGNSFASVPGRVVLDGLQLLRGAFVRMDEYSLDFVAREVLGEGKLLAGRDRFLEIQRIYRDDPELFVRYNLTDARLVLEILDKLKLVELAIARSRLTGMPLDRVGSSIAAFDFLYLSELGPRGIAAPTLVGPTEAAEPTTGGHVLEPTPGLYRNVLVFDFKSLYPSIIRTFQIDPQGYLPEPAEGDDPIVAPNGAAFRRQRGILPGLLDELFPAREAAKAGGDEILSRAIKILMNSFYGVLGTPACRFHNPEIANAITGFGREVLLWSKARIESFGRPVLYGDTDSLFVLSGEEDPAVARKIGLDLAVRLNRDLAEHVLATWRVPSRLEMEFEMLYLKILLPHVRHGVTGARKRYAGLVEEKGRAQVVFTGMEVVRRDWTDLAKSVQRELYERLFFDRPVEDYLREVVNDLRAGRLDDLLVYRKALRKDLEDYTVTTPPHVVAARKMSGDPGRLISYVMTTRGPEPALETRSGLDHEHYVQKQVRPVAEPVLDVLGLDFDRVVGDETQLSLF